MYTCVDHTHQGSLGMWITLKLIILFMKVSNTQSFPLATISASVSIKQHSPQLQRKRGREGGREGTREEGGREEGGREEGGRERGRREGGGREEGGRRQHLSHDRCCHHTPSSFASNRFPSCTTCGVSRTEINI